MELIRTMKETNIRIADFELFDEFVSIMGLGLLKCIRENIVDYWIAWDWLFNLRNQDILQKYKQSKKVKNAIELATELDAAKKVLSTELYEKSISEIEEIFIKHIAKSVKEKPDKERGIFLCNKS